MNYYDKMLQLYERNAAKEAIVEVGGVKYIGTVCGFHYKQDDSDSEQLIIAIKKVSISGFKGINYALQGDVYKTDKQNELGYEFIHTYDLDKHINLIK